MTNYEQIKNCDNEWEMAKLLNNIASDLFMDVLDGNIVDADTWDNLLHQD